MAILAATAVVAAPFCRLAFQLAALGIVYHLAVKVSDPDAVAKISSLACTLSGSPSKLRFLGAPRAPGVSGGDRETER